MRKSGIWIESHADLGRHPKTIRLLRALGVDLPTAVGHLHLLWWWATEYADDGDLSGYSDEEIADAAHWKRDGGLFVRSLVGAGFMDEERTIHEWDLYFGKLLAERESNRKRQQEWRERHKQDKSVTSQSTNEDVTVTSPLCNTATVPNPTVPNPTVPKAAAAVPAKLTPREIAPIATYAFEQTLARPITSEETAALESLCARFGEALLVDAIEEARDGGTWRGKTNYLKTILMRWERDGRQKGEATDEDNIIWLGSNPSKGVV